MTTPSARAAFEEIAFRLGRTFTAERDRLREAAAAAQATNDARLAGGLLEIERGLGRLAARMDDIRDGDRGPQGEIGEPGTQGAQGIQGERGDQGPEGPAGVRGEVGPVGETGAAGPAGPPGERGEIGPPGPQGERGDVGERGDAGPIGAKGDQGEMPPAQEWAADRVFYFADVVTCDGSTYQARHDTAARPPGDAWNLLAAAGRDGVDGRTGEVRGLYDPAATYEKLDRVAHNGSEWIAIRDDPGPLPGDGWKIGASKGSRGYPGEKGERGPPGERGPAGVAISSAIVEGYAVRFVLEDGRAVAVDLRAMFERYDTERAA